MKQIQDNLVEIHFNHKESFAVGFLLLNNKDSIVIKSVDPYGNYDGYCLFDKREIRNIKQRSKYLNIMESILVQNDKSLHFSSKEEIILFAIQNNDVLVIDSFYWQQGKPIIPISLCDNIVEFIPINDNGKLLTKRQLQLKQISKIEIGTEETNFFKKLISNNLSLNRENKLCEIYDGKTDFFDVAEIVIKKDDYLLAKTFGQHGNFLGYMFKKINHKTKIQFNTKYLSKMSKVIDDNHEEMPAFFDLSSMINYSLEYNRILFVKFERGRYFYNIKIIKFCNDKVLYTKISQYNEAYETKWIEIDKIVEAIVDDPFCRALEKIN